LFVKEINDLIYTTIDLKPCTIYQKYSIVKVRSLPPSQGATQTIYHTKNLKSTLFLKKINFFVEIAAKHSFAHRFSRSFWREHVYYNTHYYILQYQNL